jgi:hypothetical protein
MSESTWAPSPYAEQLQAIQKAIAGYVLMPADDEVLDCALQGIKRGVDRLNTRTWNWNLVYQTITFVAGTQEYALDAQFKQPRNFSLRDSGAVDRDRLSYLPWGTFLKEVQYDSSGSPSYYSASNPNLYGVVRLELSPDSSFVTKYPTGRLWYYKRVPYPGSTGGSLNVPSEAVMFLQAVAEGYAADRYAPEKANTAYGRAEKFLHELIVDDCHGQQTDWE